MAERHLPLDVAPLIIKNLHPLMFASASRISKGWRRIVLDLPIPTLVLWVFEVIKVRCKHVFIRLPEGIATYHNQLTGIRRVIGQLREIKDSGKSIPIPPQEILLTDLIYRSVGGPTPPRICVAMAELAFRKCVRVLREDWCAPFVSLLLESGHRSPDELCLALYSDSWKIRCSPLDRVLEILSKKGQYVYRREGSTLELFFSRGRKLRAIVGGGGTVWWNEKGEQIVFPNDPEEHVPDHCPWYIKYDKFGKKCLVIFGRKSS